MRLDSGGVCDRCRYWDVQGDRLTDRAALEDLFDGRMRRESGRHRYDALVGLSGGKDSTYVLYRLVVHHGLKVLAFTFDNGFLSDYGRWNIANAVSELGVEHVFYKPDWDVHRRFYLAALRSFGDPCIACPFPGSFAVTRYCQRERIPFFVHGRSPFQLFRNYFEGSNDVAIPQIEAGLEDHSHERIFELNCELDRRAREWLARIFPDEAGRSGAYGEFFIDPSEMSGDFSPEHLAYFLYHPYDEERIKETIERDVGYTRPSQDGLLSHGDCEIHDASSHLFQRIHGTNHVALEVAVMLRRGVLTAGEAREIIEREESRARSADESVRRLCDGLGISRGELDGIVEDLRARLEGKFDCH